MKAIDKWFAKKVEQTWNNRSQIKESAMMAAQESPRRQTVDASGFSLRVYKASGGTVVEFNKSSNGLRVDDGRSNTGLYVITDDKDLGAELGKIITMEGLR